MNKKSVNFILPLVVYPYDVMFSFGQEEDEVNDMLLDYGISDSVKFGNSDGRTYMFGRGQTLIYMPKVPNTPTEYGVLQHEIFHAVIFIMKRVGIKLSSSSEEAFSYLIGYITKEVHEKLLLLS